MRVWKVGDDRFEAVVIPTKTVHDDDGWKTVVDLGAVLPPARPTAQDECVVRALRDGVETICIWGAHGHGSSLGADEPLASGAPPRAAPGLSAVTRMVCDVTSFLDAVTDGLTVFDLETTGVDVETSRIVTAHVGVLNASGDVEHRDDWLVDPGIDIPDSATAVHGITTVRARTLGVPAPDAVASIIEALRAGFAAGRCLVAYNAAYDLTLLHREALRYGIPPLVDPAPVIDPYIIDKAIDRYRRGRRTLGMTAAHYGVQLDGAHDAGADAIAAGRLALAILARNPWLGELPIAVVHARQIEWCRGQAANYEAWRRSNGEPEFTTSGAWPLR